MAEQKKRKKRRFVTYFLRGLLLLLGLLVLVVVFLGLTERGPGAEQTPAGYTRNESQYVVMDDGTQIAVDVWYPANLAPGEVMEITFDLIATSALIEVGHQIRLAIAGHDAAAFQRLPAEGKVMLDVQRNPEFASLIDLPVMERGN